MDVIGFIVGGFFVGLLGRLLVPGRQPLGCLFTTAAGMAGSLVAGLVGRQIWGERYAPGFLASIVGAALVVFVLSRALGKNRRF
ncbi:MAG: hypothetical protein ABIM89_12480 [Mycobacteriales bacterium]